jgi:hypothetical protein
MSRESKLSKPFGLEGWILNPLFGDKAIKTLENGLVYHLAKLSQEEMRRMVESAQPAEQREAERKTGHNRLLVASGARFCRLSFNASQPLLFGILH